VHREIGDDAIRTLNGVLDPTITLGEALARGARCAD